MQILFPLSPHQLNQWQFEISQPKSVYCCRGSRGEYCGINERGGGKTVGKGSETVSEKSVGNKKLVIFWGWRAVRERVEPTHSALQCEIAAEEYRMDSPHDSRH